MATCPAIPGLHHVTAITGDAPGNVAFYTRVLGLRLVKKTVNQDDVSAYHLFYGDARGSPGMDMTFFDWPHAGPTMGSDLQRTPGPIRPLRPWAARRWAPRRPSRSRQRGRGAPLRVYPQSHPRVALLGQQRVATAADGVSGAATGTQPGRAAMLKPLDARGPQQPSGVTPRSSRSIAAAYAASARRPRPVAE